ncbi:nicotinamide mononucleotide transporter [Rickettsiella massiliensis]
MITVGLYMIIFFDAKLYADACLQIIFIIFQFYGIYQWLYGGKKEIL